MRPALVLRFLGEFEIVADGVPYSFVAPPRTLPLLAYLLLHRDAVVSREMLAYTLWPDRAPEAARADLRRHLHYLQKALPPAPSAQPWFRASAKTVSWNGDAPLLLDIDAFEAACRAEERAAAIDLYRGNLLCDLDEEWLLYERERLSTLYAANLLTLIEVHRARRDFAVAIGYAKRLIAHDSWREDAVRHMMCVRYEMGDRAGAMNEYELFAQRLWDEMNVSPMPETTACYETIVAGTSGDPMANPSDALDTVAIDRWALLPFAGRNAPLERLRATWNGVQGGSGATLLIGGEAGIGKTRLVTVFAQSVERDGGLVARGGTSAPEANPYEALTAALQSVFSASHPVIGARDDDLEHDGFGAIEGVDAAAEQRRLFGAIGLAIDELTKERPLLIVLEDLHRAGAATISLLDWLARYTVRSAVLIVATYRDEGVASDHPLRRFRQRLARALPRANIALGPLDAGAFEEIVVSLTGDETNSRDFAAALHARSNGNPFFLGELLRDQLERRIDSDAPGAWFDAPAPSTAPSGIREMIGQRLARLSPETLTAAEVAAVIGGSFNVDIVRDVGGWTEAATAQAITELLDHHIVRDVSTAEVDFAFAHDLINAAIYDRMIPSVRRRRHRRVAQIMERAFGPRRDLASQIAHHFELGGEPAAAAPYRLSAAIRALALYANEEARDHALRGLDMATAGDARIALLLILEESHRRLADREAQRRDLESLAALLDSGPADADEEIVSQVLQRRVRFARALGDVAQEERGVAQLAAHACRSSNAATRAAAIYAEGSLRALRGDFEGASALLREAAGAFAANGDVPRQVDCILELTHIRSRLGDSDQCAELLAQTEALTAQNASIELRSRVALAAWRHALTADDVPNMHRHGVVLLDLALQTGDGERIAQAHRYLGIACLERKQVADAFEQFEAARIFYERVEDAHGLVVILISLSFACAGAGRFEEALAHDERAAALAAQHGFDTERIGALINVAERNMALGRAHEAQRAASEALSLWRVEFGEMLRAEIAGVLGIGQREAGQLDEAIANLEESLAVMRRLQKPYTAHELLAELAIAYVHRGHTREARAAANEIVAQSDPEWRDEHNRLFAAAFAYRAAGDAELSVAVLDRAHGLMENSISGFADAAARRAYVEIARHRAIEAAFRNDSWPAVRCEGAFGETQVAR